MPYLADKVFIGESPFGKGVFANQDFLIGQELVLFEGPLISWHETKQKGEREGDALQVHPDYYMDLQDPARLINHSCKPNAGIRSDIHLVALRDIKQGEELFYDYSTTMDEEYQVWTMTCQCGFPECRKLIGDFSKLPKAVRDYYLNLEVVQYFIAQQYR